MHPAFLPAKRRSELLRLLQTHGQLTIEKLAAHLLVSGATIRRDVDFLASQGVLTRTYGGAVANEDSRQIPPFLLPDRNLAALSRALCPLIHDQETLLLNEGLVTRHLAGRLRQRNVTVVTNSLALANHVAPGLNTYLLGGWHRREANVTIGPLRVAGMHIVADVAVIQITGVCAIAGLSIDLLEEAPLIRAMLKAARRTVAVVQSTGLNTSALASVGPLSNIQTLVTDEEPGPELRDTLAEKGVRLVVARDEQANGNHALFAN